MKIRMVALAIQTNEKMHYSITIDNIHIVFPFTKYNTETSNFDLQYVCNNFY